MNNFERVFNNCEELHPMVNGNFFTIPIAIEMTTFFRTYFKMEDYSEFINKIKSDSSFKEEVINYVKKHFKQENRYVISSEDGLTFFFVEFKKNINKPYTLKYVESLCCLNTKLFLDNYVDIFGNNIEFEVYS